MVIGKGFLSGVLDPVRKRPVLQAHLACGKKALAKDGWVVGSSVLPQIELTSRYMQPAASAGFACLGFCQRLR
jgi:hypothetical protein